MHLIAPHTEAQPYQRVSREGTIARVRALADALGRTPNTRDWREAGQRPCYATIVNHFGGWDALIAEAGLPAIPAVAGWGVGSGHRTYWTDARVAEAMRRVLAARPGRKAPTDRQWERLTTGDTELPVTARVRAYGGTWRESWRTVGADVRHLSGPWQQAEDTYLLENAGRLSLERVAHQLGRTRAACKRRLYDHGTGAREARGLLTAAEAARAYGVPSEVINWFCHAGVVTATKGAGGHGAYWQIDPDALERVLHTLTGRPLRAYVSPVDERALRTRGPKDAAEEQSA